jgi:hypothetical protein
MILNRTTGYNALMRFLRDVFTRLSGKMPRVVELAEFSEIFDRIRIGTGELTAEQFRPGSSGASALYRRLVEDSGL